MKITARNILSSGERPMKYFGETEATPERIGHVIGDIFALGVYICVAILMITHFT